MCPRGVAVKIHRWQDAVMHDWEQDLAQLRQRLDERLYYSAQAVARWQQDADAELVGLQQSTTEFDQPLNCAAPEGAPPQYRNVVDQFGNGHLDWETVLSGDTQDEGGRAMSMWMDQRLHELENLGQLIRAGATVEDAYTEVTRQTHR
jgi:hypothetical protein